MSALLPSQCPSCGTSRSSESILGLCAACLWRSLSAADEEVESGAGTGSVPVQGLLRVPGHTVVAELARGGMGIVYQARQQTPARDVALKMLLPHQLGSSEMRARFQIEVRAGAALSHPAILPIYEVGECDGQPFFTMKLALGGTLAARCGTYRGQWRAVAELTATLADAVQFAHARGVLHRDLKPANVLFDEEGRPYISDFGLAKFTAEIDAPAVTHSLATLGTPNYLAPEVVAGGAKQATTGSDLYALGAVLYELIAGRPPFLADSVPALLRKIAEEEPPELKTTKGEAHDSKTPLTVAPTGFSQSGNRAVGRSTFFSRFWKSDQSAAGVLRAPRDLELIARKCLRKDPAARYGTASAFADDLRRWLRGEPIHAKPVTRREMVRAWAYRNPALATVSGLLALAVLAAAAAQAVANRRLRMALGQALLNEVRLTRATGRVGQRFDTLALVHRANETARGHWLYPAYWRTEVAAALAQPDLRLVARWRVPESNPDGSEEFSADLAQFAVGSVGTNIIFDVDPRRVRTRFLGQSNSVANGFRFSPDGRWLAVSYSDGRSEVWSRESRELWTRFARPKEGTTSEGPGHLPEFLPDGLGLLFSQPPDGIYRSEFADGHLKELVVPKAVTRPIRPSPDGRQVLVNLPLVAGPVVWSLVEGRSISMGPVGTFNPEAAAWAPDSATYAIGQNTSPFAVTVVKAQSGELKVQFVDHEAAARRIAFHPDGQSLASVGSDGRLVWRSSSPDGWRVLGGAVPRVLQFSTDGQRLALAPSVGELAVFELAPPLIFRPRQETNGVKNLGTSFGVSPDGLSNGQSSPDGRWRVTVTATETFISDAQTSRHLAAWGGVAGGVAPAFSPDSRWVAAVDQPGRVTLHAVPTGEEIITLIPNAPMRIVQLHVSADGAQLGLVAGTGRVWEWDLAALRRELAQLGLDWN